MLSISLRGLLAFGSTATAKFKGILSCCRIASAIGVNWGSGDTGLGMLVATILTEAPSGGSSTEVGATLHRGSRIHFHLI